FKQPSPCVRRELLATDVQDVEKPTSKNALQQVQNATVPDPAGSILRGNQPHVLRAVRLGAEVRKAHMGVIVEPLDNDQIRMELPPDSAEQFGLVARRESAVPHIDDFRRRALRRLRQEMLQQRRPSAVGGAYLPPPGEGVT